MPGSTVSLSVLEPANPYTNPMSFTVSTAAGNSFDNDGETVLLVQNQNASARTLTFYADINGAERTIGTVTLAGVGTDNGYTVLGPFDPSEFNNHNVTDSTKTGHVMISHSGANSDVVLAPLRLRPKAR